MQHGQKTSSALGIVAGCRILRAARLAATGLLRPHAVFPKPERAMFGFHFRFDGNETAATAANVRAK